MKPPEFSTEDLAYIAERGSSLVDVAAQLQLLRNPPAPLRLASACVAGSGVRVLGEDERAAYAALYDAAAGKRRIVKFVPASGAASRMFRELLAVTDDPSLASRAAVAERAESGDAAALACLDFLDGIGRFGFVADLERVLERRFAGGSDPLSLPVPEILRALLEDDGLGYARRPKALLKFHAAEPAARTALEEHLAEGALYARGEGDICRLHLTVSPEHMPLFRDLVDEVTPHYEGRFGVRYDIGFSVQDASTDAMAIHPDGFPFRDESGRLLFRPGGHGALLHNLAAVDADLIFVKNIDNVVPDEQKAPTVAWKKALGGIALDLERQTFGHVSGLETSAPEAVESALAFLSENFHTEKPAGEDGRDFALDRLCRPLRVCGMVENTGEPGGGPFWVGDGDGAVSAQVVETSQVDLEDPAQADIVGSATHFNPVDLVCATRDPHGRPYVLADYVDPEAIFFVEKSHGGRPLRSLERPGLWNGSMARWNTVFVEVPAATFNPVKSVLDLLRPGHQPLPS